jgi:putative transposase
VSDQRGRQIKGVKPLCFDQGAANELLSVCQPYEQLSAYAAVRQRRWEAYVEQTPDADELAAIRRSVERSLPFGCEAWVEKLSKNLELDLTIRPRGRPKKSTTEANK